jgi:hypothetical protein
MGQLELTVPTGTHIVLFRSVNEEQGWVALGQIIVSFLGLVTFTNGVPVAAPQILVPLTCPILIG